MTPLRVTAELRGPIAVRRGGLALDALLAAQVALRDQLPPPRCADDCQATDIPIALHESGRFHLASFSRAEWDAHELKHVNKRAPVEQYQTIGDAKIRRVLISGGANKSYRVPMETMHAKGDRLTWWCVGDAEAIRVLLATALYLGRRRAVGLGRIEAWTVEPCEPWGEGFPVARDGAVLRPLPADFPGLVRPKLGMRTITFPYWAHEREEMCACP